MARGWMRAPHRILGGRQRAASPTTIPQSFAAQNPAVAITDCSPLWLKTCHRHVFLTRRARRQREPFARDKLQPDPNGSGCKLCTGISQRGLPAGYITEGDSIAAVEILGVINICIAFFDDFYHVSSSNL